MRSSQAWISSQYNYCFIYDSKHIIYNTLHTKIYLVDNDVFDLLVSRKPINESYPMWKQLQYENLIVPIETDETSVAYHYMHRIIYDNRLNITIIPTQKCNFKCIYCFENHTDVTMSDLDEKKIINFFKRNVRKHRAVKICWFGGEPLIEKNRVLRIMQSIKQICEKASVPMVGEMITNGYLLDVDTFNQMIQNNVLFYEITLDGFEQTHNRTRPLINGNGTYTRILQNLINIQQTVAKKRFKVVIRTNLDRNNADSYSDFVKYISGLLNHDKRFEFSVAKTSNWGGDSIDIIKSKLFDNHAQMSQYILREDIQDKKFSIAAQDLSQMRCQAGKYYGFVIMPNAEVHKCTKISYNASDIACRSINNYGYITESGQMIVDESKQSQFLALPTPYDRCKACTWLPICLLSSCPYRVAENAQLICKCQNEHDKSEIEDAIKAQFSKGIFTNLTEYKGEPIIYG